MILIIDQRSIATQSAAGKTIPGQADTIKSSVQAELQAEADKLKKDIENYQKSGSLMSEEVRRRPSRSLGRAKMASATSADHVAGFRQAVQNAAARSSGDEPDHQNDCR